MPCLPCDMTQAHEGQGVQTNGSDVRAVRYVPGRCATRSTDERQGCAQRAPPERAVKTPPRSFWHIGRKNPMKKYTDETPQIPSNGCRTRTSRHFWGSTLTEPTPPQARLTSDVVEVTSSDTLTLSTLQCVVSIGIFN